MTRKELEARQEFENIIIAECHGRDVSKWAARLLLRHAKTYASVQTGICNGVERMQGDTPESFNGRQVGYRRWLEKREAQLEARIREVVQSLGPGFGVVFSGDPRGVTVKLTVPSGKTNDWGADGICIPTATA